MKKWLTYILLLFFNYCFAQSDSTHLSLEELLNTVESTYPDVLKFTSRIEALELKSEAVKGWMPPQVSAGLSRWPYNMSLLDDQSPMNQAGFMISAKQMIPNPGKINAKSEYLQSREKTELYNQAWTKNELRSKVRKLYYLRFVSEKRAAILDEHIELLEMFIRILEDRYSINQSGLPDIYKARAKKEEMKNMRLAQDMMISQASIAINSFLGRELETVFSIDTSIVPGNYSPVFADTFQRSDIAAMEAMISSLEKEKDVKKSQLKPDFGVEVSHMQMLAMPTRFSVMGMMTIPIVPWSAKAYNKEAEAIDMEVNSMKEEVLSMERMAERNAAWNLTALYYSNQRLDQYGSEIIPAFKKNMDASLLDFKQNTGSFFVVLDAWEMLLMKELERTNLLGETLMLEAEFLKEVEERR